MEVSPGRYYPLFADLAGRRCVVVGGGLIAQRKVTTLLGCGAAVTVISPTLTKRLAGYARKRSIRHQQRPFRPSDLAGAWLVLAATDDQRTNTLVSRSAARRRIFTNVVDQKPLCSFIAPAIVRRGPLTIAISTGGASPALAKRLRRELGERLGGDYISMLRLLAGLRGVAKRRLPSYQDRKRYFDALVGGRVFALVKAGKRGEARRTALALLEQRAAANGRRAS
ncbi:MAG: bifunctional precorrin-2 dehydrogenase/sirohydrochlorin ferrochelatase [Candidatus Omnitrophica bacterium]|nr:bifunctional precorrin-2 dehydrogenase/sirohydrochlorin ferrochelatase [Candidatus Omnitrophota bacterium]